MSVSTSTVYCAKILLFKYIFFTLIWRRQKRALLILSNYKQYLHIILCSKYSCSFYWLIKIMLRYYWQLLIIRSARFWCCRDESEKLVPNNLFPIARVKKIRTARAKIRRFLCAKKCGGQPGRVSVRVRTGPFLKPVLLLCI